MKSKQYLVELSKMKNKTKGFRIPKDLKEGDIIVDAEGYKHYFDGYQDTLISTSERGWVRCADGCYYRLRDGKRLIKAAPAVSVIRKVKKVKCTIEVPSDLKAGDTIWYTSTRTGDEGECKIQRVDPTDEWDNGKVGAYYTENTYVFCFDGNAYGGADRICAYITKWERAKPKFVLPLDLRVGDQISYIRTGETKPEHRLIKAVNKTFDWGNLAIRGYYQTGGPSFAMDGKAYTSKESYTAEIVGYKRNVAVRKPWMADMVAVWAKQEREQAAHHTGARKAAFMRQVNKLDKIVAYLKENNV